MRIGIDVDDVVADLLTPWLQRIAKRMGQDPLTPADLTQWEFWHDLGTTAELVWGEFTPDIYEVVEPHFGVREALFDIQGAGHTVVFVTQARSFEEFQAKREWLYSHNLVMGDAGIFPVGPWSDYKSKGDPRLRLDWLVDDHVRNLDDFKGYGVLVTRPHNRLILTPYRRVKNLSEVAILLKYHAVDHAIGEMPEESALDQVMDSYNYTAEHCALVASPQRESCVIGGPCWSEPAEANIGGAVIDASTVHENVQESNVRVFETGATRDTDNGKYDYEAFLSPAVLERYAEFMHKNRFQSNGSLRDGDNWQKGIPTTAYMKSLWRHFFDTWKAHRRNLDGHLPSEAEDQVLEEALTAIMFNAMGYLHEHLKRKSLRPKAA